LHLQVTICGMAIAAMARLLNAVLDISKLKSSAIRPQVRDFALALSFKELRIQFSELAQKEGLQLEVPQESVSARSDPALLGQILQNLIGYAIRYTSRGTVRVRVAREAEWLRIEVEDSGVGISQDQVALIFDEFYQVGVAPYTVREGHGLGPSIVRRAAELLDHELRVRSELGRGSTFSISVPAGPTASVRPAPAEQ
jgi:two-component system, sensor histidine kinase